jgi:hypothetical protein
MGPQKSSATDRQYGERSERQIFDEQDTSTPIRICHYDNALPEIINGLYKAELTHRRAP